MTKNLNVNKVLWFIVSSLSLAAGLIGIINSSIYNGVVNQEIISGMISQDIITILSAIIILVLIFRTSQKDLIKPIIIIALTSYFFYGYGIYVIERIYNTLYFIYMSIFGLSFYSLIYSLISIKFEDLGMIEVAKPIRYLSIGFSFFIPVLFYPLWISQLIPLIQTGQKNEFFYSIPILDLCFIMPAFIIVAIFTIKNRVLGLLLTPALFIHGFALLFSVAVGGMLKPFFNQRTVLTENLFYLSLSTFFLVLTIIYIRNLKINKKT